ncbi:hypothetical protein NEOLI_000201 [Neolecta irregularis DAH-3]|uniref:Uncharacterized protein n=1 Tax=Neolecta irregularis (strain DAH-3) TaxID=1198029 RepID=A0A1U7LJR2_NEOID|nr:hypothetical protein NEOLI_000201 [Neolecta irregularis DAH-3]|eukprot:OLL22895.1 hypothetical protein NEOLI_000201 [Neolecta irregularis DAH-3]
MTRLPLAPKNTHPLPQRSPTRRPSSPLKLQRAISLSSSTSSSPQKSLRDENSININKSPSKDTHRQKRQCKSPKVALKQRVPLVPIELPKPSRSSSPTKQFAVFQDTEPIPTELMQIPALVGPLCDESNKENSTLHSSTSISRKRPSRSPLGELNIAQVPGCALEPLHPVTTLSGFEMSIINRELAYITPPRPRIYRHQDYPMEEFDRPSSAPAGLHIHGRSTISGFCRDSDFEISLDADCISNDGSF